MEGVRFQDWPESFSRNVDLVPSLKLQEKLNPQLEVCHIVARTSRLDKSKVKPPRRAGSLKLSTIQKTTSELYLQYGEPDFDKSVSDMEIASVPELREGIEADGFEDVAIAQRVVIHEIPKSIEHLSVLQGYDQIFEAQMASAKRSTQLRDMLGLHTWNPKNLLKANLLTEGHITDFKDPSLNKLKSCLVTEWMKPSDPTMGVFHFSDKLQVLETELSKDYPKRERWWLDTGIHQSLRARIDEINIDIRLFKLLKHDRPIALSLPQGL